MQVTHRSPHIHEIPRGQADIQTHQTVRQLELRGLAASEATNLTAYLCGFTVGKGSWKLGEINELLFLRYLNRRGRFGPTDGSRRAD